MSNGVLGFFSNQGFMPHIHCYLGKPSLVWTMVVTDMLIGLAYVSISLTLWRLVRKIKIEFSAVVLCFGVFIGACGATHFMEVYTLWIPDYWNSAFVKIVTAIASVGTGIYLIGLRQPIVAVAEAAKLSEVRRRDLEALTKNLEARVEERTSELQRALEVRDDFFSVASHELRTPLTSLNLKAQMAARGTGLGSPEQNKKVIGEMNEQVERLTRLVEDMLDIARYRGGTLPMDFGLCDIAEVVGQTLDRLAVQIESSGITLSRKLEGPILSYCDRLRVEQVVSNLVVNATKYAPNSPLGVSVSRVNDYARIVVSDGGPGIAAEDRERIFNKFERLNPRDHSGGLGVGLYLSRAIIEAHDGRLSVESESGKGTTFVIDLPLNRNKQKVEGDLQLGDN